MNDRFCFFAEPAEVIKDSGRSVAVGLGEVGGLDLVSLSVGKQEVLMTLPESRHLTEVLDGCDTEKLARTGGYYLHRVEIVGYPDGAWDSEYECLNEDWAPEGWNPDAEYIRHGHRDFFWPSTKREYKSKSAARARARLIESYGATTRIVQSSLITWPAPVDEEVSS
ncbi:hypothetical protein AB0K45_09730 [Micrococcus luteus]|uniref:DUF7304 family protein n=1 Tax=Micrococcus luteus TaxID=1270 RepID=UPI00341F1E00